MEIKRHMGRLLNTDRRIVVVFMQIPGKEDHALVVDTDALPDRYHDGLMDVVESIEGQQTPVLADILTRRILPDTGSDILTVLHNLGRLQRVPVENVVMYPKPNLPMPLVDIIRMNDQTPQEAKVEADANRATRFAETSDLNQIEAAEQIAKNLLLQARDLKAEADRKAEEAYRVAPHLRPKSEDSHIVEQIQAPPVREALDIDEHNDDLTDERLAQVLGALKETYMASESSNQSHVISDVDEKTQAFLDRAAFREDKEAKASEPQVKRPVGRPKKNAG